MRWSIFERYIRTGQLTVIAANGEQRTFGCGEPHATIEFTSADCLSRLLRNPQLNLGETYMQGAGPRFGQRSLCSLAGTSVEL